MRSSAYQNNNIKSTHIQQERRYPLAQNNRSYDYAYNIVEKWPSCRGKLTHTHKHAHTRACTTALGNRGEYGREFHALFVASNIILPINSRNLCTFCLFLCVYCVARRIGASQEMLFVVVIFIRQLDVFCWLLHFLLARLLLSM